MTEQRMKRVVQFVLPTMMSNVCFFLFTILDGIFVGRGVGTDALGAVNIVMPFVLVTNALFVLLNIGGVATAAIKLGQGYRAGFQRVFQQSMSAIVVVSVLLCIAGTLFPAQICTLLGATETYHAYATEYLFWYSVFLIPSGLSMGLQAFVRNDNAPTLVSVAVIASTISDIILDWLLIFPIPLGVTGAAVSTGIGQVLSMLIVLPHVLRKKGNLCFGKPMWDIKLIGDIVLHGLPECIAQLASPIATLCMNWMFVTKIGDIAVNAYAVMSYVASFSVALFFGTSEGLQPLLGQSYGAGDQKGLRFYFRVGMWINIIGSILVTGAVLLFGRQICGLFGIDAETLTYTLDSMPCYAWGFIVMSVNVMISSYLYSTNQSVHAILLNVLRSFVISVPVMLLLPELLGANSIWYTFGVYEAIVLIFAIILLKAAQKSKTA